MRDSEYLNWRYLQYPLKRPQVLAAYDEEGKLRGFTVIQVLGRLVDLEIKVACITEMFMKPGDKATQLRLLQAALAHARREDVDLIETLGFAPEMGGLLRGNLFLRGETKWSPYLYKNNEVSTLNISESENNWFISLGDGDAAFS